VGDFFIYKENIYLKNDAQVEWIISVQICLICSICVLSDTLKEEEKTLTEPQ